MTQIATSLRETRESAKRLRFESSVTIPATNVQDAITQGTSSGSPTPVNSAMSPYAPVPADRILMVDTSAGPVIIQMPLSATRGDLEIKDATGNAGVNAISVLRSGAETIDGMITYPIDSPFAAVKFGSKTAGYFVHA